MNIDTYIYDQDAHDKTYALDAVVEDRQAEVEQLCSDCRSNLETLETQLANRLGEVRQTIQLLRQDENDCSLEEELPKLDAMYESAEAVTNAILDFPVKL